MMKNKFKHDINTLALTTRLSHTNLHTHSFEVQNYSIFLASIASLKDRIFSVMMDGIIMDF